MLPGDVKIKKAKIRGVESRAMICSEKELGISDQHEGVILLDAEAPPAVADFGELTVDTRVERKGGGAQRLFDGFEVVVARHVAPAGRDDAAVAGDLPVADTMVKRRQQLAQREVARAAEAAKAGVSEDDYMMQNIEFEEPGEEEIELELLARKEAMHKGGTP